MVEVDLSKLQLVISSQPSDSPPTVRDVKIDLCFVRFLRLFSVVFGGHRVCVQRLFVSWDRHMFSILCVLFVFIYTFFRTRQCLSSLYQSGGLMVLHSCCCPHFLNITFIVLSSLHVLSDMYISHVIGSVEDCTNVYIHHGSTSPMISAL